MADYSNQELADIHFMYGMANGNSLLAQALYREKYPIRRVPNDRTFAAIHRRLRETGQFKPIRADAGRPMHENINNIDDRILQKVNNNPEISLRRLEAEFGVPYSTIWKILHRANLYPYHLQRVQVLQPRDNQARLHFSQWFLNQPENFGSRVLFTDESEFTRDGINNFHNQHLWALENPHGVHESNNQRRFSLNVWAGIFGNVLLGPVFLPPRLNGRLYRDFLMNTLPELLEEISLHSRREMWFMHDGAPAHFAIIARNVLNRPNYFRNRWIGRAGPVAWPARSPDMNPLDFFLWGHCKSLVYSRPVVSIEDLRDRIQQAFQDIRGTLGILDRVNISLHRRMEACVLVNGGHFEQLI